MKVIFNGDPLQINDDSYLSEVLFEQAVKNGFNLDASVVAVNLTFIHKTSYSEFLVKEGDEIELLAAVVGG